MSDMMEWCFNLTMYSKIIRPPVQLCIQNQETKLSNLTLSNFKGVYVDSANVITKLCVLYFFNFNFYFNFFFMKESWNCHIICLSLQAAVLFANLSFIKHSHLQRTLEGCVSVIHCLKCRR